MADVETDVAPAEADVAEEVPAEAAAEEEVAAAEDLTLEEVAAADAAEAAAADVPVEGLYGDTREDVAAEEEEEEAVSYPSGPMDVSARLTMSLDDLAKRDRRYETSADGVRAAGRERRAKEKEAADQRRAEAQAAAAKRREEQRKVQEERSAAHVVAVERRRVNELHQVHALLGLCVGARRGERSGEERREAEAGG